MKREERETVRAMPVPSRNPIAEERDRSRYAILRLDGPCFAGLSIEDGVANRITPDMNEEDARRWLSKAQSSAVHGTVFPTFCKKGHLRDTRTVCGTCLKGTK